MMSGACRDASIRHLAGSRWWVGIGLALCLGASPALADRCECPVLKIPDVVKRADVIFVGKSLSATSDASPPMRNNGGNGWLPGEELQTRLLFDVGTVIKGKAPRFVEVVTPATSCAFRFAVGKKYLVVGTRQGGAVSTDACQGNTAGDDAIDDRVDAIRDVLRR